MRGAMHEGTPSPSSRRRRGTSAAAANGSRHWLAGVLQQLSAAAGLGTGGGGGAGGLRRLPFRWLARLAGGVLVLNVLLQLRVLRSFLGLQTTLYRDGAPVCTPYDPVARPGLFRIQGTAFNFTSVTPEAAPERLFHGRGVVMTASGNITRQAAGAFVTAFAIRHVLKESVPIEIFYAGEAEAFSGPIKAALDALDGVRLLDLEATLADLHGKGLRSVDPLPSLAVLRSYAAKLYAVQAASFREALLFDAGAVPFVPTDRFFALPSYRRHGLALFSDYVAIERHRWAEALQDLCLGHRHVARALGGRELDSSAVVVDKVANADALAVAVAMNGPLQARTYRSLLGDKDTWALAMLHVGKALSVEGLEPGYLLVSRGTSRREKGRARKVTGHLQFYREPHGGALVPLHHNNQLLDLREYPAIAQDTYMETFAHLGDVLMPGTRRRDCRPFPTRDLMRLPPAMHEAYLAVAEGLRMHGIDHCVCRDDWISCEQDVARLRRRRWALALIDRWFGHRRRGGSDDPEDEVRR